MKGNVKFLICSLVILNIGCIGSYFIGKADVVAQDGEGLRPLDELMPQMEARQSMTGTWRVWSKAYDVTEWSECDVELPTIVDAEAVMVDVRLTLAATYAAHSKEKP